MKIRTGFLRGFVALALFGLAGQIACRAALVSVNTITNDANRIGVFFDVAATLASATNLANYSVLTKTGAVAITSVTVQTNSQYAELNLAAPIGEFFAVTASNIVDVASSNIDAFEVGYISDYVSARIGAGGNPNPTGHVYTAQSGTFEVTVGGSDVGGTNDFCHLIYGQIVSNFDMSVMVERLDQANALSKAGLMARESLSPGSKTLQTYFTPIGGSNEVEVAVRTTNNATTTDAGFQIGPRASATPLRWLRLTRTNDIFTAYHGTNGNDWTVSGVTTQAFLATLNIGMMATAHTTNGTATTAKFTNFRKSGARPGDGTLPTLNAALSGGTNLNLSWTRVPRDFAVEVSTDLTSWQLLLLPIVQGGTNGSVYSMSVPLNVTSNQMFLRLSRVERVIPDPDFILTTGIIISPGAGLSATTVSGSALCGTPVISSYAQGLSAGKVIAPVATTVTFSSSQSDALVDTVLQIRNAALQTVCDDNSAANYKSIVLRQTTAANLTNSYSIVIAPKTNPPAGYSATGVLRVKVTY